MQNPDASFWKGKRVLVTGHTGFKGSWLSLWLQLMDAEVCGFALRPPSSLPTLFEVAGVAEGMRNEIGDIRDYDRVLSVFESFRPEIVLHLAAQPLVRRSYADPIETYSTNVMGLVNVLEVMRRVGSAQGAVNVTSDKCYENREFVWGYREDEPMGGFDPYSNSKGCAELVTGAFRDSYYRKAGIAIATARAGNVIGGGDWSDDRLIPDILRAFSDKKAVTIRNPQAIRPWQHVIEPLSGYLVLAERLLLDGQKYAEPWNFGPEPRDAKAVQWIVEKLAYAWGEGASWQLDVSIQPHEANYLQLDISKARHHLNWHPRWGLETGIEKTMQWHRAWLDQEDMRAKCLGQIAEFLKETV